MSTPRLSLSLALTLTFIAACGEKEPSDDTGPVVVQDDDADGDRFDADVDCDDSDPSVYPGAAEVCDGVDNNCDGSVDEGVTTTFYADGDGDGFGDAATSVEACVAPSGYVPDSSDCDDSGAAIYPGADEVCDGLDNNCDGEVDEEVTATFYADGDGDGFGDAADAQVACEAPSGFVGDDSDCDDADADTYPGADEYCDGHDDNCDGEVDEGSAIDASSWYTDADGDSYGDAAEAWLSCEAPTGTVADSTDCDDGASATYPGADEYCDGLDTDCDGEIDEDDALDASTWYVDVDADGYGDPSAPLVSCEAPSGYLSDASDCDDSDAEVNPDGIELCDDVDNDCDGDIDWAHRVPSDYSSVQSAIDGLSDGDTVCVEAGTYTENLDLGGKDLTLIGTWGAASTVLDGGASGSVLTIAAGETVSLSGFTVQNGLAQMGAGVYVDGSSVTLTDVSLFENACAEGADACYGVLYGLNSTVSLTDSDITDNEASSSAGNVYGTTGYFEGSTVTFDTVSATGNAAVATAEHVYGNLYFLGGVADLSDSDISGNTAESGKDVYGGGFFLHTDGVLTLDNVAVDDNEATAGDDLFGTAAYCRNGVITITDSSFDRNIGDAVDQLRGANTFWGCDQVVSTSSFDDNVSDGGDYVAGGGLYARGAYTDNFISSYEFISVDRNASSGGDLYGALNAYAIDATFANVTANENTFSGSGEVRGGGISHRGGATASWDNVEVVGNVSTSTGTSGTCGGGGVFVSGPVSDWTNLISSGNSLVGCREGIGGGVAAWMDVDISLTNTSIVGNHLESRSVGGGGVYVGSYDGASLLNVDVSDNTVTASSTNYAGGVYERNGSGFSVTHTNIHNNDGDETYGFTFTSGSNGNLASDPLYTDLTSSDPMSWDLTLSSSSPLIDAGDSSLLDADGSTSDIGAYGGPGGASW